MKRITNYLALFAAISAVFASCSKEVENPVKENPVKENPEENGKTVNITINASYNALTKTYIDGSDVKWASSGEFLKVLQDKDGAVSNATSSEGITTDGGETMTFAVSFAEATGTAFNYYAFYPASSLNGTPGVNDTKLNTPAAQTPTTTSFDPAADLLVAKKVANGSTQATSLDMQFARVVAVGKMTITNLQTSDPVKKVIFSAQDGGNDVKLAGRTAFDLETAVPVSSYASSVTENSIILDYSSLSLSANVSMVAFFTCYPFDLAAGDSFTVSVQTATKTYTRTVNLTGDQVLSFIAGKASRFSVNMSTAAVTDNAVDLRYACLTAEEYHNAGGSSYANLTVSKPHGDKWATYATYNSSSIGIRKNDTQNDSYVKLPDLVEDIKTVVVTFTSSSSSDNKITLETTATGKTGDIMSKEWKDMDGSNRLTFDLTSLGDTYKTAYVRSNGGQALLSKIEVYAGTDNRAAKAPAPASVEGALNGSDPNTIDVTWTAASGAAGYIVTLTPTAGDAVVKNAAANATSISFDALPSSTTFTPSVVTVADPYLYMANSDSQAGSDVATGAPATTTIAGIKEKTTGSEVAFSATLTNALVTIVSGNQFYMEDASGAIWVNTSGHGMSVGDKISGDISGTVKKTSNNFQIVNFVSSSATKTTGNTVTPTVVAAATLASYFADYESKYVKVNDVKISGVSGKNLTLDGIDGWIVYNDSDFNITENSRINAVGIVCYYNSTKEVKLFTLAEEDKLDIKSTIIATDKNVAVGGTVSIGATKNTPATITYESGDASIATVSDAGVITGKGAGSTTITMRTSATGVYTAAEKVITVTVTGSLPTYSLYSGAPAEGDYVIVYNGKAMNTTVSSNRLQYSEPEITDGTITNPDASIIWHISASGDYWVLYNADANKYAAGTGTKNQGAMINSVTDYAKWTWTKNDVTPATYKFENKGRAEGASDTNNKWLKNNGTYGFACYASGSGDSLSLYKLN